MTDSLSKCNSEKCFIYSKCSETSKLFFQCTRNEMSEIEAWVDRFIQIIARIFTTRNSRLCIHSNAGKICYMIRYIKHSNWFWQFRLHLLFFTHFTSAYHYHLFRWNIGFSYFLYGRWCQEIFNIQSNSLKRTPRNRGNGRWRWWPCRNGATRVNSSSRTDVSVIHKVQIKPFNVSFME